MLKGQERKMSVKSPSPMVVKLMTNIGPNVYLTFKQKNAFFGDSLMWDMKVATLQ